MCLEAVGILKRFLKPSLSPLSPKYNSIIAFGLLVPNPIVKNCPIALSLKTWLHPPNNLKVNNHGITGKMQFVCQISNLIFLYKKSSMCSLETIPKKIAPVYWARLCSKIFPFIDSLNLHHNPVRKLLIYIHFSGGETETEKLSNLLGVWNSH